MNLAYSIQSVPKSDGFVKVTYSALDYGTVVYNNDLVCYYDDLKAGKIHSACIARMKKKLKVSKRLA